MYRSHNCGELRQEHINQKVVLSGWIQRIRDLGGMTFIDLRDRYGISQLVFNMDTNKELCISARELGREFVIQISGLVLERSNKNSNIPTGEIEIDVKELTILSNSELPPFTIETESDGGDELRMKYRYLDLRRPPLQENLKLRHNMAIEIRKYLSDDGFLEIETPFLIKSTPEGARDFVVPSRLNSNQFYALPQSPQTYKQLLMISGFDKYFQIVRCFRDEDLRADRQPEFTQIDCELSFVEQEDILNIFEGMTKHLLKKIKGIEVPNFKKITYEEAMSKYGSDKPDLRFDMHLNDISDLAKGKGFKVFDQAESIIAIAIEGRADYSRKQLDALTDWVRRPQIGASGLIWLKYDKEGNTKSSIDKFFSEDDKLEWIQACGAQKGDLLLIIAGEKNKTRQVAGDLRLEMGERLDLRKKEEYVPLWVIDFPLLEWNEEEKRYTAMHHPFTSPKKEDLEKLKSNPAEVKANAYDLVINGVEIGGGSIRIHDKELQMEMFKILGFTQEEAYNQFGFLMDAFRFGAPPHGGIAFGFDRFTAIMAGLNNIRDFIAFPKNNNGRDMMSNAPSIISEKQLNELLLKTIPPSQE